jgi:type II secretory pathway pseudopilin PulG
MNLLEKIKNRLKSKSAETLIETLASILIVALSAMILATFVMSASRLNQASQKELDEYFEEKSIHAERLSGTPINLTVTIEVPPPGAPISFNLGPYIGTGSAESLRSYWPTP